MDYIKFLRFFWSDNTNITNFIGHSSVVTHTHPETKSSNSFSWWYFAGFHMSNEGST